MKWTRALWVSAGVLVALASGCSGSVKSSDDDAVIGAGNSGTNSDIAGGVSLGGENTDDRASAGYGTTGGYIGRAGQGGAGGMPSPIIAGAGWGGEPDPDITGNGGDSGQGGVANDACDDEHGNGCIIEHGSDITALTVDDSAVYWVEHGTSDALGNYRNDGRLLKRDFATSTTVPVATGLAGPVGIGLTTTHYFVYLDQAWDANGQNALARIPIAGGSPEIIQRGAQPVNARGEPCPSCFAHSGGIAYFPLADGIYEVDSAASAPVSMTDMKAFSLTVSGQFLYFEGGTAYSDQIWRMPLIGGAPERVASQPSAVIQASGLYLYGIQQGNAQYFARMPLEGSIWTRLAQTSSGAVSQLSVVDSLYFYDSDQYDAYLIYQGIVADPSGAIPILTVPRKQSVKAWAGTTSALYWTDGHSIRMHTGLAE